MRSVPGLLRLAPWVLVIAVAITVQMAWSAPQGSMLWSAVFDAGHMPLFGLVALAVLRGLLLLTRGKQVPRPRLYLAALVVTVAIGGITEFSQYFGLRDADPFDFLRNAYGALCSLMLAYALDRQARHMWWGGRIRPAATRILLGVGALALLLAVAIPVMRVASDYLHRNAAFPAICEFDAAWQRRFAGPQDAVLTRVPAPDEWVRATHPLSAETAAERDRLVGRLTFQTAVYPALHLMEPYPDWSGYDRLVFDAYSELDEPVELSFRVNDIHHDQRYADRFNRTVVIHPGANRITFALDEIERGPRHRRMDMKHIRNATLFAIRPQKPFTIYVDSFRLERD